MVSIQLLLIYTVVILNPTVILMAKFNPTITAYLVPCIIEGHDNKNFCCWIVASQQLHMYFTNASLALHKFQSNITCITLVLQCCCTQLYNNFTSNSQLIYSNSQQLTMFFTTTSLALKSSFTAASHALHLYFTVASLSFTTTS